MDESLPASLPLVTAVDVVDLNGLSPNHVSQFMECATDAPAVTLLGGDAERIARLWRELPPGMQSRCHSPPYGFRFYSDGREVCRASVCWDCDNIFGDADGQPFHYEFDSRSQAAVSLRNEALRAFGRQILPHDSASST